MMFELLAFDGDIKVEEIPLWQKCVPWVCFLYTAIVLAIAAVKAANKAPGNNKSWVVLACVLPIVGPLVVMMKFRKRN